MDLGKNSTVWQRQEQNSKTNWRHQEWILRWTQSVTEPWVFQMKIFIKRQPRKKPATNRLAKQSWSWRITDEKATSNGNCLYNSASIILNGNEDLSLLLRLLTAVELYKNAPFYATHPNSPEAASDCCLPEISLFIQFLSDWGLKVFERWSYCWMPGQKIVRNDSHDSSFNCYWQANILSLSWMQQKYSSSLSQRYFATRLWYKVTRH